MAPGSSASTIQISGGVGCVETRLDTLVIGVLRRPYNSLSVFVPWWFGIGRVGATHHRIHVESDTSGKDGVLRTPYNTCKFVLARRFFAGLRTECAFVVTSSPDDSADFVE